VKRLFVTVPMMLPRLSDRAAAQLLEILDLLHGSMQRSCPESWCKSTARIG
jgi:hypothetical protein